MQISIVSEICYVTISYYIPGIFLPLKLIFTVSVWKQDNNSCFLMCMFKLTFEFKLRVISDIKYKWLLCFNLDTWHEVIMSSAHKHKVALIKI